jgi:predicted porin
VTEATANGTAWSRRINNSVQYWSPVFGGFQFKLMAALANYQSPGNAAFASGLPKAKEMSANVTWARGPFSIAAGYDAHEGLRPGTAAGQVANPKDDAFNLGAKWNFGLGEVGVGYEKLSYEQNNNSATAANGLDVENMVANGRINVGPGAIWGSYSTAEGKSCTGTTTVGSASCGLKAKMSVLGYDYVMSKRTKMYIAYAKIDNAFANGVGTNYYYIAGPAGNNSNGTASGIQAGTDVTTLAVGIQHLF